MISLIPRDEAPDDIPGNDNHLYYAWNDRVFFSAARHGKALSIHLAARRDNWRYLRRALCEFCDWLFCVWFMAWVASILMSAICMSIIFLSRAQYDLVACVTPIDSPMVREMLS